jgi:hypothetical protein
VDFPPLNLISLLGELSELESNWMDEQATGVIAYLAQVLAQIRDENRLLNASDFERYFTKNGAFLDVCRLFIGVSQETSAHQIAAHLPPPGPSWTALRRLVRTNPAQLAEALVRLGLPEIIFRDLNKPWTVEEMLIDRYRMSRGRATAGQARGRSLEAKVEEILRPIVPYEARISFVGRGGVTAKSDFVIPDRNHPKIVIEAKGFEATGSKLTDFLGDIRKIIEAKESRTYFFIVTDGRGWFHRKSDLQHIIDFQHLKDVDMVYTSATLTRLAQDVAHIWENERGA